MIQEYIEKHRVSNNFNTSEILDTVVKFVDEKCDEKHANCLIKRIHEQLFGKHFDEDCALITVNKMYFCKVGSTAKVFGAFIPLEQSHKIYSRFKDDIPKEYNAYDFYVTLNMMYCDNFNLYSKWFKDASAEAMTNIVAEAAVNWLNDPDSPYSDGTKIWSYLKH